MSSTLKIEDIDHSDIGAFLQTQPYISGALYKALTDFGHNEKDLRKVIKSTGTQMDQDVRNQIRNFPQGVYHRSTLNQYDQGNPTGGKANYKGITSVKTAQKIMPSAFDSDGFLKPGYSFTPGEGKSVVATSMYDGNDVNSGGMVTIYGPGGGVAPTQNVEVPEDDTTYPTTGDVDPPGLVNVGQDPITAVDDEDEGPDYEDLYNQLMNREVNISIPSYTPPPPPPIPNSYAAIPGLRGSSTPGVRIRESRSRAQGANTMGTQQLNRNYGLTIGGINV